MKQVFIACAVLPALLLSACQGVKKAPEGSRRVELEVQVNVDDALLSKFQGIDDQFKQTISDVVISKADVGLRFYPNLASEYGENDARAEYAMSVDMKSLDVLLDHDTVVDAADQPKIVWSVKSVSSSVASSVVKRRASGPDLPIGRSTGISTIKASADETTGARAFTIENPGDDGTPLSVSESDLLKAYDQALVKSLNGLVEALNREFAVAEPAGE